MKRCAPACCCTLAVLLAAALPAAALAANITHRGTAKYFRYAADGELGSNWATNLPPDTIPGGVNPSNAVTRLTADTRLAFVGAFDAYFRRLMASVAFGTEECTNYIRGGTSSWRPHFIIDNPTNWYSDVTISTIFVQSNEWYVAANRDYAVTNISVVVSNFVGWTTNVVTLPSGKKKIKIENRYEVETRQIPDTTRILARYHDGHDYLRGNHNLNGLDKMIEPRYADPGPDGGDTLYTYTWPQYDDDFYPPSGHEFSDVHWGCFLFAGWGWSTATAPDGIDPYGWESAWVSNLCDAAEHWGYFYPTTWDFFAAPDSRSVVWGRVFGNNADAFLLYDQNRPDEWERLEELIKQGASVTNFGATSGFESLTNLVQIYLGATNDAPLRAHMMPTATNTYHRIVYPEWAGTDGFLALADTAIAGPMYLPHLVYDGILTNISMMAEYETPRDSCYYIVVEGEYGADDSWTVTNREIDIGSARISAQSVGGVVDHGLNRAEGVDVRDPTIGFFGNGQPGAVTESPTETEPAVGINRMAESRGRMRKILGEIGSGLHVGDILLLGWGFVDGTTLPRKVAAWQAENLTTGGDFGWFYRYPNAAITASVTYLNVSGTARISSTTSLANPRPFRYQLDEAMYTNSIPCTYPNPSYAGRRGDSGKVEFVDEIKPTAISTIASTTNTAWMSEADAPVYRADFDTNGYLFAVSKPGLPALRSAKDADDWWVDVDAQLKAKMVAEISTATGIAPSSDPAALAAAAKGSFDLDILPDSAGGDGNLAERINDVIAAGDALITIGAWCDPANVRITRCDPGPPDADHPDGTWVVEYETVREDTNGVWQATGEDVWRCYSVTLMGGITNTTLKAGGRYAAGRMTGVEAVRWDFDAMKRAREPFP